MICRAAFAVVGILLGLVWLELRAIKRYGPDTRVCLGR